MEKNENKVLKKEDFLNTRQLAAKLGENIDVVRDSMRAIFNRGTRIVIKNHKTPMVTHVHGSTTYRLHPYALEEFKEYLEKRKARS